MLHTLPSNSITSSMIRVLSWDHLLQRPTFALIWPQVRCWHVPLWGRRLHLRQVVIEPLSLHSHQSDLPYFIIQWRKDWNELDGSNSQSYNLNVKHSNSAHIVVKGSGQRGLRDHAWVEFHFHQSKVTVKHVQRRNIRIKVSANSTTLPYTSHTLIGSVSSADRIHWAVPILWISILLLCCPTVKYRRYPMDRRNRT